MSRTTADLLAQLERFLPPRYAALRPVLAGIAAQLALADATWEDFATASTVGGASDEWLTLLARGYGIDRSQDETDGSVRGRIRNPVPLVTPAAILAGVNDLLEAYTATPARLVETLRAPGGLTGEPDETTAFVLDLSRFGAWNHFTVIVPRVGTPWGGGSVLELLDPAHGFILGIGVLGLSGSIHPVYFAIVAFLRRARAAGIRVTLVIED